MFDGRLMLVAGAALLVSGCAGGGRRHLARLQSQGGLPDERVTQLERMGPSASAAFSTTEMSSDGAVGSETGAAKKRSMAITVGSKAGQSSGKPSTREIQQALKEAGFYQGTIDGKMGPMTRQAVEEFQRVNGLKADGVVGRQTWAKLQQYAGLADSSGSTYAK